VKVLGFVAGEVDEVIEALRDGNLPHRALSMPGCSGRQNRFRGGKRPGRETGRRCGPRGR
jgi:hypothetical protein